MADLAAGLQAVLRGPSKEPTVQSPPGSEGDSPRRERLASSSPDPHPSSSGQVSHHLHSRAPSPVRDAVSSGNV